MAVMPQFSGLNTHKYKRLNLSNKEIWPCVISFLDSGFILHGFSSTMTNTHLIITGLKESNEQWKELLVNGKYLGSTEIAFVLFSFK